MFAILGLIPSRVWEYLGIVLALSIAFGAYTLHERRLGAAHELAAVVAENAAVTAAADQRIADLTKDYTAKLKGAQDAFLQNALAADKQHAADVDRLRKLAAYYQSHAVLPSAGGTGAEPDPTAGSGSAGGVGVVYIDANVPLDLASALRHDDDLLAVCRAERDSLTGK
jgi:hypothetical protein